MSVTRRNSMTAIKVKAASVRLLLQMVVFASALLSVLASNQSDTNEQIAQLIVRITRKPTTDAEYAAKVEAIKETARLRPPPPALVRVLVDNYFFLTRKAELDPSRDPMMEEKYSFQPARDALREIGQPAAPVLIDKIKETEDSKRRLTYSLFLRELAGGKSEALLQEAIEQTPDSIQKERLKECLQLPQAPKR
jgi:hypothetical protein